MDLQTSQVFSLYSMAPGIGSDLELEEVPLNIWELGG